MAFALNATFAALTGDARTWIVGALAINTGFALVAEHACTARDAIAIATELTFGTLFAVTRIFFAGTVATTFACLAV